MESFLNFSKYVIEKNIDKNSNFDTELNNHPLAITNLEKSWAWASGSQLRSATDA